MIWGCPDPKEVIRDQKIALMKSRLVTERHITSLKSKISAMEKKLKKSVARGADQEACIYAEHLVRLKENHLRYVKLKCKMEAVELEIQHAIQTSDITDTLKQMMRGVTFIARPDDVVNNIESFERMFDAYKTSSSTVTSTMDKSTALNKEPSEEANRELEKMKETIAIEQGTFLPKLGDVIGGVTKELKN